MKSDTETFVTQIRMSEALKNKLRERAEKTGASFNSTMCLLLDIALNISERAIIIQSKE